MQRDGSGTGFPVYKTRLTGSLFFFDSFIRMSFNPLLWMCNTLHCRQPHQSDLLRQLIEPGFGFFMKNSRLRSWGIRKTNIGRGSRLLPVGIVIVAIIGISLGLYFGIFNQNSMKTSIPGEVQSYPKSAVLEIWSSGDKTATLKMTRASLEISPLDPFYLSFNGIAAYYISSDKPEGEEKQSLLDEAVFSLRKAMASGGKLPVAAQVEYVLGKAYFQKGQPWYDLAAKYLSLAKKDGYEGRDSEQYLGLSYAGLLDHEAAVSHFEAALEQGSSDVLMLSAAISYKELGNLEKTSELLGKVVESASDALIVQRARFMLGDMAMAIGDTGKAQEQYQAIVDTDPRSAEGWFRLGLIAEIMKDPIKARADWRKATSIDPNHIEARKKLAERL